MQGVLINLHAAFHLTCLKPGIQDPPWLKKPPNGWGEQHGWTCNDLNGSGHNAVRCNGPGFGGTKSIKALCKL